MGFILRAVFPFAVTLVALGAALYRFDIGGLTRTADALSLSAFLVVTLALLAGNLLACVRLQLIARDMNHRLRFLDVLVALTSGQLAGSFFFQIFGQTLARSATLAKSGVSVSATIVITVNPATVPTFTAIAPVCAGSVIDPLPTTSDNGITGNWSPAPDNTATTTYTFSPDPGQCAATATLTITVNDAPDFTVSQGCDGVSYMLTAVQDDASGSAYAWINPAGQNIGSGNAVAASASGTYQLTVTQNGCSATQNVEVLSTACSIQKGISANNDGLNDTFNLAGYNVKELKIFNRYGTAVYSKTGYQNEWYGQSDNGDELPDGTYYYLIDFADAKTKTGWIYINRAQ